MTLSKDNVYEIALRSKNYDDILSLCRSSSEYLPVCDDERLWQLKLRNEFDLVSKLDESKSWKYSYRYASTMGLYSYNHNTLMDERKYSEIRIIPKLIELFVDRFGYPYYLMIDIHNDLYLGNLPLGIKAKQMRSDRSGESVAFIDMDDNVYFMGKFDTYDHEYYPHPIGLGMKAKAASVLHNLIVTIDMDKVVRIHGRMRWFINDIHSNTDVELQVGWIPDMPAKEIITGTYFSLVIDLDDIVHYFGYVGTKLVRQEIVAEYDGHSKKLLGEYKYVSIRQFKRNRVYVIDMEDDLYTYNMILHTITPVYSELKWKTFEDSVNGTTVGVDLHDNIYVNGTIVGGMKVMTPISVKNYRTNYVSFIGAAVR